MVFLNIFYRLIFFFFFFFLKKKKKNSIGEVEIESRDEESIRSSNPDLIAI